MLEGVCVIGPAAQEPWSLIVQQFPESRDLVPASLHFNQNLNSG